MASESWVGGIDNYSETWRSQTGEGSVFQDEPDKGGRKTQSMNLSPNPCI